MPDPIIINPDDLPIAGSVDTGDFVPLIKGGVLYRIAASALGGGSGSGGTTLTTPSLTATPSGSSAMTLNWSNVANENSYELQRSPNGTTGWTTIATPAANVTSFNDTGLTASTTYYYRVRAIGNGTTYLNSGYGTANGTTGASGSTQLSAPTLSASVISSTQINLSWTNVASESSFQLQMSLTGALTWLDIASPAADVLTFSKTDLDPSTGYDFRVRAVGNGTTYLTSPWSSVVSATTGASGGDVTAPTVVSANTINPNTVRIVFSESVTATTAGWSFKKNGSNWPVASVSGSGTTWDFVLTGDAVFGDTLLRSYDSGTGATVDGASNELASFTDQAVTNNELSGAPYIVSKTTFDSSTLQFIFNEAMFLSADGWSFKKNGSNWAISSVSSMGGDNKHFIMDTSAASGDIITVSYDPVTGNTVGGILELEALTDSPVTNTL